MNPFQSLDDLLQNQASSYENNYIDSFEFPYYIKASPIIDVNQRYLDDNESSAETFCHYESSPIINMMPHFSNVDTVQNLKDCHLAPIEFNPVRYENCSESLISIESPISKQSKKISKKSSKSPDFIGEKGKKHPWQAHEDAQVLELTKQYGFKWSIIAKAIGNRTGKQVRDRYNNYLRPEINNNEFTPEEDQYLLNLYQRIGNKWSKIAENMPGRSECQVKNRYHVHLKKTLEEPQTMNMKSPIRSSEGLRATMTNTNEYKSTMNSFIPQTNIESHFSLKDSQHEQNIEDFTLRILIETEGRYKSVDKNHKVMELMQRKKAISYLYEKTLKEIDELKKLKESS